MNAPTNAGTVPASAQPRRVAWGRYGLLFGMLALFLGLWAAGLVFPQSRWKAEFARLHRTALEAVQATDFSTAQDLLAQVYTGSELQRQLRAWKQLHSAPVQVSIRGVAHTQLKLLLSEKNRWVVQAEWTGEGTLKGADHPHHGYILSHADFELVKTNGHWRIARSGELLASKIGRLSEESFSGDSLHRDAEGT